ncbi:hypothetical protein NJL88_29060 [Streptomyces sp. DK15]|uniref:hypothetical protein n=1 Tax=Streptomyces sp. DK15 TaxID=2957499 RepID=UPI0029B910E7|nr:hypothetical protein [Streptomyces sp. DK15]MDX2394041.1 hypothetical protein [Streptomyces sp. DK15]
MERGREPRVYGWEPGEPAGPTAGHEYVELVGGPLDGQLLDVTGWTAADRAGGALLIADLGLYGPGGRADYAPDDDAAGGPFRWRGDTA